MNLVKGLVAGLIAGIVGVAVWAAIGFYAQVEIGYLAWGIGALVGFAVAFGVRGGGAVAGLIAVLITIASICGGKYVGASWAIDQAFAEVDGIGDDWTDEDWTSNIASELLDQAQGSGQHTDFQSREEAFGAEAFPAEIWQAASKQWADMDDAAKADFRKTSKDGMNEQLGSLRQQLTLEAFKGSFGPVDIVFFLLGVVTAWKIACSDPIEPGETHAPGETTDGA